MKSSNIKIRSLDPVAATEITSIDLAQSLDELTFAVIETAFNQTWSMTDNLLYRKT